MILIESERAKLDVAAARARVIEAARILKQPKRKDRENFELLWRLCFEDLHGLEAHRGSGK